MVAQAGLGVPAVTPAGEEQHSKRLAGATGRALHSAAVGSGPLVGGPGLASGGGGPGASGSRVEVPPQLVYHVLRDKELRLKLQQQGLPVDGKRQDWVERYAGYRRWVQAELDKGSRSSPAALLATFLRHQRHQAAARRTSPSLGLLQQVVDLTGPRLHCSTHGSSGSGAAGAVSAVGQQAGLPGQAEGDCGVDVVELPDDDGDEEGRQGVVQHVGKVDGRGRGPTHSHQDLISQVLERMQRQKRLRSQEREQYGSSLTPGQQPRHNALGQHHLLPPGAPTAASGLHRLPGSMGPGQAVGAAALPGHPPVGCGALHAPASQGQTLVGGCMGQALQLSLLYEELEEDVDGDA
ncbi:SAP domain-containing protein [Haematococcus lacustris]|uniref:SAP domain-containing protein n=1 Tax=Haematococcus lacustris TaxID=44745 RepID=A0A699ZK57_HAELA|nr:SAP domain-containing protein [Haematococcus lacustris]